MKQGTKQRIVGSVVLISLALIFLPIILDGEGSYQAPVSSRIPEPPVVPVMPEPTPTRPLVLSDNFETEPATAESETELVAGNETGDDTAAEATAGNEIASSSAAGQTEPAGEPEPGFRRQVPQFETTGLPRGWAVRMGSFSDPANAGNLLQRLQDAGYKAYSRVSGSGQGQLTVVYVGPWLERQLAQDYLIRLQDQFQLAGLVERYEMRDL